MRSLMLVVLVAVLVGGCAASLEEARIEGATLAAPGHPQDDRDRCQRLDNQRRSWGALAKGSAVLAGATGASAIPFDYESDAARVTVGTVTVGAAVFAAAAVKVSEDAGDTWARECAGGLVPVSAGGE